MLKNRCPSCLNPCFVGIYSRRVYYLGYKKGQNVLILVLLEYTLGDQPTATVCEKEKKVLILVLLEYTLGGL